MSTSNTEIKCFRDLLAWQRSYALGLDVIRTLGSFPSDERFGLALQLRRSCVSVPSNIAEGYGRGSRADYIRFLYITRGSLYELNTQLQFAGDLGYVSAGVLTRLQEQLDECERLLWGLIRALERNAGPPE